MYFSWKISMCKCLAYIYIYISCFLNCVKLCENALQKLFAGHGCQKSCPKSTTACAPVRPVFLSPMLDSREVPKGPDHNGHRIEHTQGILKP